MAQQLPLADVKILDFTWVMAGPATTRILADFGATVVRIESPRRIDTARTLQPFHNDTPGPDNSGLFGNCNAGKFGISLDLDKFPRAGNCARSRPMGRRGQRSPSLPARFGDLGFDYEIAAQGQTAPHHVEPCLMGQSGRSRGWRASAIWQPRLRDFTI